MTTGRHFLVTVPAGSSLSTTVLKGIDRFPARRCAYSPDVHPGPRLLIRRLHDLAEEDRGSNFVGAESPALLGPKRGERVSNAGVRRTRFGAAVQPEVWHPPRWCVASNCGNLEQIKGRLEAAVPGVRLEIIPNDSPAKQPSLLVDVEHALAVARFLRDDPQLQLDHAST